MSLNYYWASHVQTPLGPVPINTTDPRIHIALRVASKVLWAQDPEPVRLACEANRNRNIAVDEYDRDLTGADLLEALFDPSLAHDRGSIGTEFS